jgi:hypothetical protein
MVTIGYDTTLQSLTSGIDCLCLDDLCVTTYCVSVNFIDSTCGISDLTTYTESPSDVCSDCTICSTESGIVYVEADDCHTTDLGCFKTQLPASIPGSTSTGETQGPTLTSAPDSSTISTAPPTDPSLTSPPTSEQIGSPNVVASSGATLGYIHAHFVACLTIAAFLTMSLCL